MHLNFDGETFRGRAEQREFSCITARNCAFEQCYIPAATRPGDWNRLREVALSDVSQWNCSIDTAAIENVTLHNLKRAGDAPLFLWGCVFRNVTVSGRISGLKINRSIGLSSPSREAQAEWDRAVLDYYRNVDWALDISEAKFGGGVTFEAVPGNLIRRDPHRQILVTREKLSHRDWQSIDFDRTAINLSLSWFLQGSQFDSIVIAARSDPKWAIRDLAVLERFRSEGVAEFD